MSRAGIPLKSECVHGHPRTPENIGPRGHCRECERARGRRRYRNPSRRSYCIAYSRRYRGLSDLLPCCGHAESKHDPNDGMRCYFHGCECEGPR